MSAAGMMERIDADLIEPQRLAECVIDRIKIDRRKRDYAGRALSAREALLALTFEAQLVALCAENQAQGIVLTDADRARLLVAWARITTIIGEACK